MMKKALTLLPKLLIRYVIRRSDPIELGRLERIEPVSEFGFGRGSPIDRYYIETFLLQNSNDIQGSVLEVADNSYTKKFGGVKVKHSDILHANKGNPKATIVSDLAQAHNIPSDCFDCIILTQTLQYIYDVRSAIGNLHRILKPGGVLLTTVPGISPISKYDMEHWGEYWHFTTSSVQRLFEERFQTNDIEVKAYGNVLIATAFLYGLAVEDLKTEQLNHFDPYYQTVITARVVKSKNE
jgi:SAM-dependent methyltransferase